ncbi:MAG: hypothetical protein JWQ98_1106 [Chlorobi bacterium]|nr:hypothetical protein [Chlorobiota bacterium]
MIIHFRTLCTLSIVHDYYRNGCGDFGLLIPEDTARALRNGHMLVKEVGGRFHVLYGADELNHPLVNLTGTVIRIGLTLNNPYFTNFTRLDADFSSTIAIRRNTTLPVLLDPPVRALPAGGIFSHAITDIARPATITLKNRDGVALSPSRMITDPGMADISFDPGTIPEGEVLVEEVFSGITRITSYYRDGEFLRNGAVAAVEIEIGSGFYASPPDFQIAFVAKEELLKYYVVAKQYNDADFGLLSVSDTGFSGDERPEVAFAAVASDHFGDDEIPLALLRSGDDRVVLFRSTVPVKRQERGRRKIQLNRNGEILIPHLPQPGADRADANMIIHISKP